MKLRTITTSLAVAALATSALGAGYTLGRDASEDGIEPVRLAMANTDLVAPHSCADLLASYVDRALDLVGPWGWHGPVLYAETAQGPSPLSAARDESKARTSRAVSSETGTNVQEAGVDEADVVKASGDLLVVLRDRELVVHDVTGDEPEVVGRLALDPVRNSDGQFGHSREMLLVGDRVVVATPKERGTRTTLMTVDIADPATPEVVEETTISAPVSALRLHGDVVRAVADTGLPELDFVHPRGNRGERRAEERNRELVRETTIEDWIPSIDGEAVDCASVAYPDDPDAPLGTTTVVAFDPASPTDLTVSGVAVSTASAYFSPDRLYLAAGASPMLGWWGGRPAIDCWGCGFTQADGVTRLFAFELDGTDTTYVASGEVDGYVRDRWSMDANGDSLRLAVGPSSETGNFNSVVTLREDGNTLVEEGRVDKLGPNEDIKSVRWFDDLAIVVTFRQVDPLYAVDLTDPAAPLLLGELKIPGFSEYLHPLGPRRMIGIGQDASLRGMTRGAQAALFGVHDLTNPRQLDVERYARHTRAGAGTDPRQFTWLPEQRTALTVISRGWGSRTGWVSVLRVEDGQLHNRMVEVEYGSDVDDVRLVPLASGRVVLVTGDDVSFFEV